MDLSTIAPKPLEFAIIHPGNGSPTGLVLEIVSTQDDAAAPARRAMQDRVMAGRPRTDADTIEWLAGHVKGWRWNGGATWGGAKLDFTPENLRTVLSAMWVRVQLDDRLGKTSDFFPV